MRKIPVCLLLLTVTAACMSSPEKRYLQLDLAPQGAADDIGFDAVMLVDPVRVDDLYEDFQIVYRLSPFEMNFYSYVFWAENPSAMVRNALAHYFQEAGIFKAVIKEFSEGGPDLILRTRVHILEEIDRPDRWYARLSMDMEVVDFDTSTVLVSHRFDRTEPLPRPQVGELPVVLSRILREEILTLLTKLSENRRPGRGRPGPDLH
jgi:ABC-type uncharacterized transport system auxiliary subunit